jgi:hypothetical protein
VADNFQRQINAVIEVVNSIPDQLIQLEGRVSQSLAEATALAEQRTTTTMPADVATQEDLRGLEQRRAEAQRDADARFGDIDDHIARFLQFMRDPPFLTYLNSNTLSAQQKANEAWIKANAVDDQVRQLPIHKIREDIADQLDAHN